MRIITSGRVFANAGVHSWRLARDHTVGTAIGALLLVAGGPLYSRVAGWSAMKSEILNFVFLGAGPLLAVGGAVFLWNLWLAPFRLLSADYKEGNEMLSRRLSAVEGKIDHVFQKATEFSDDVVTFKASVREQLKDYERVTEAGWNEVEVRLGQAAQARANMAEHNAMFAKSEARTEIDALASEKHAATEVCRQMEAHMTMAHHVLNDLEATLARVSRRDEQ